MSELSRAIVAAIKRPSYLHHQRLAHMLWGLAQWTTRPHCFAAMAYEWCSVICEKYRELDEAETLLFLSLQVGFRHLNPHQQWAELRLVHTQHHRSMADIVFRSQQSEVIADFLHAWTSQDAIHEPCPLLRTCGRHLVGLPDLSSSPRLRRLVTRSVELIGHQEFEKVGVGSFVALLNRLDVSTDDVDSGSRWIGHFLDVVKSPEGRDRLSYAYWELLVELSLPRYRSRQDFANYDPQIMSSLRDTQQWDKLACWICAVWLEWPSRPDETSRDLKDGVVLLFRQRPGSVQMLEEWMKRSGYRMPKTFRRIREQACLEAEQSGVPL